MNENQPQRRGTLLMGILLIGFGIVFLMSRVFHINVWGFLWPMFIAVPGVLFFVGMVLGGKSAGPLAIPGSIVTMTGLLLLYQQVTGHWESWAYAWALIFPTSVGVGLVISGGWSDVDSLVRTGMRWITAGLAIFLLGGLFFEMILNISNNVIGNVMWPVLLIGAGIYLLARRGRKSPQVVVKAKPEMRGEPVENAPPSEPEFEPLDANRR